MTKTSDDKPLRVFGYANSPRVLAVMVNTSSLGYIFPWLTF